MMHFVYILISIFSVFSFFFFKSTANYKHFLNLLNV